MPALRPRTWLVLWFMFTAGALGLQAMLAHRDADRQALAQRTQAAQTRLALLESRLYSQLNAVGFLANSLGGADPDTLMRVLARLPGLQTPAEPLLTGAGLVSRVPNAGRIAFEDSLGTSIRAPHEGRLYPSPSLPVYFPVRFYAPDTAEGLPQGFDAGSLPGWNLALESARENHQPYLLPPSSLDAQNGALHMVASLPDRDDIVLVRLSRRRLLDLTSPSGPTDGLRLVVWQQGRNPAPFLDTLPQAPLPTARPLLSAKRVFGGLPVMVTVFSLGDTLPVSANLPATLLPTFLFALLVLGGGWLLVGWQRRLSAEVVRQEQALRDSTEQLQAQRAEHSLSQRALTESEARQRAILQASSDAILLIDHDGRITHANPAAARLIGQSAVSVEGLPIGVLLSELYRTDGRAGFRTLAMRHAGYPFEAHLVRNDNSRLPVEVTLSQVILPNDRFYVAVCRDISVRKEQEAALIRLKNSLAEQVEVQRRQLSALLEASPLAMAYVVNRDFKQVNRAFLEMFRLAEDQTNNLSTRILYDSDTHWERAGRLFFDHVNDGRVIHSEQRLVTGDGTPIWCRMYGKVVNPSMPGLGSVWVYQDISAQRAAEEALRDAKNLAEETSRAKTEFLANMSHELRTPMHAVLGFAEMGATRVEEASREKLGQYFERIHTSGRRLMGLLNDLLDLAKMEAGRMEYHFEALDVAGLLAEACEEMASLAERSGLRFEVTAPEGLSGQWDSQRIRQVVVNLLSNAIRFSPPQGVIELTARRLPALPDERIEISVTDHGPGIPPAELESIFDKFIQSSSTKTGAGGTGLGLAICREIVTAHQGQIHADNAPHGGARFAFILPVHPVSHR